MKIYKNKFQNTYIDVENTSNPSTIKWENYGVYTKIKIKNWILFACLISFLLSFSFFV